MESQNGLNGISHFEYDSKEIFDWKRRVNAIFAAKVLNMFLENEPTEDNIRDIVKAKKSYVLLLSMLSDGIFASL